MISKNQDDVFDPRAVRAEQAALATAHKEVQARAERADRWQSRLEQIGRASGMPYEVQVVENHYLPRVLIVQGIRVPVCEGLGMGTSLEIYMPWHAVNINPWERRLARPDVYRSRQRKDGSFNYAALGVMARRYAEAEQAYQLREGNKAGAEALVKQLKTDLNFYGLEPSGCAEKPVLFRFSISQKMTAAEARAMHAALKLAGLI